VIVIRSSELERGIYTADPLCNVDGVDKHVGNDAFGATVRDVLAEFSLAFIGSKEQIRTRPAKRLVTRRVTNGPAVTHFDRSSKSRLHYQLAREFLLVRKECRWATGLTMLGMAAFLVACEHKRPRASKTGSPDANQAFAEYAARANTSPTAPTGNVSSRGGTGFPGGGGGRGGNQSGF
jgi:hypothetical protein